jgi:hypothetical protein
MTINISVNGDELFNWSGNAADVSRIEQDVAKLAASGNLTVQQLVHSAIFHVLNKGGFFSEGKNEMLLLTWGMLSMPTNHPDHPGYIRDYVEAVDFDFDITNDPNDPKKFSVNIQAHPATSGTA